MVRSLQPCAKKQEKPRDLDRAAVYLSGKDGEGMMILYGLKNCDTCRKALKALSEAGFVDIRAEGVPEAVLSSAFNELGNALLNTRSTTWRELSQTERAKAPIELIKAHPTVMKRPLIEDQGRYYLGWTKTTQEALLG